MSDHEFERQVRQKLSDLKLPPTAKAWEHIEMELGARKRRPAPVFWLPLLLIGLGAGGYFILKPSLNTSPLAANEKIVNSDHQSDGTAPPTVGLSTVPADAAEGAKNSVETPDITPSTVKPEHKATNKNDQPSKNFTLRKDIEPQRELPQKNSVPLTPTNRSNANEKQVAAVRPDAEDGDVSASSPGIPDSRRSQNIPSKDASSDEVLPATATGNEPATNDEKPSKNGVVASSENDADLASPTSADSATVAPAIEQLPPTSKMKSSRWSFGISGTAGASAVSEGRFVSLGSPQVEDVALIPDFAAPAVLLNYAPPPSKIYPGVSFSGGLVVKRELSRRFALSAGVNYLQMNTRIKVGYRMDASQIVNGGPMGYLAVNRYYLPENSYAREYKNKLHFIEIPVTLHTRLNKSESLPIYWNAGVSVAQLIASNTLHYDGTTGVYYKNNDLLNQLQAGVNTGFSVALFNRSGKPLWVGPSVRYNLSTILKKDVPTSKNFMGLGLDVKWFLK